MRTESSRRTVTLLLTLLLVLATIQPAAAATLRLQATSSNFGSAVLELESEAIPVAMTRIPFRLWLSDENSLPLTGADVRCSLDMPSMTMPENKPKVFTHNGTYIGELIFTCTMGAWRISFDAVQTDGRTQHVTFTINQVRMS